MIVRASLLSYPWFCSILSSESTVESGVWQACVRHVLSAEHHRIVYIRETESFLRCRILSRSIHSRFLFRGRESYSLLTGIFPQSPQDRLGGRRSSADLAGESMVVIYIIEDVTNESAARCTIGYFSQEVREIKPCAEMADERFAHSNRLPYCMVANRVALLLQCRLRSR
jgi:hypothetical protein